MENRVQARIDGCCVRNHDFDIEPGASDIVIVLRYRGIYGTQAQPRVPKTSWVAG